MRSVDDIELDRAMPAPTSHDADEWDVFCNRVTDAERVELSAHGWLALAAEHRGGGRLEIPEDVASDPRLTPTERVVLAAILDVERDADMAEDALRAVCLRLFGRWDEDERTVDHIDVSRREVRFIATLFPFTETADS